MFGRIKRYIKAKLTVYKKIPVVIRIEQSKILENRVAVITGGGSGIGKAIAKAFLENGAKVIICGRDLEKLKACAKEIGGDHADRIYPYQLDITNFNAFSDAVEKMNSIFPKTVSILVNNAGVNSFDSFLNITEESFDQCMNTNLKGTVLLSQEIAKQMIVNKVEGNILNIGSSSCFRPAISSYHMSKWALRGLTMGMARTLIKNDIVVNGIAPGPTATEMINANDEDLSFKRNPCGRMAVVDEIASMAVKLVSDSSRLVIGEMVCVTGGSGNLTYDDIGY